MSKDTSSPVLPAFPLRRSPLLWLGLLGALFLSFAWLDSRSQYSQARALGPGGSSLVVYSAESAVRLRMVWWDDRLDLFKWNKVDASRTPASFFGRGWSSSLARPAGLPGAFPGRAWERNDGVTTLMSDLDTGDLVHSMPFKSRYTAMRFDYIGDAYGPLSPASDHYARLDIVAPYWFLLMLYVPAWLGLLFGLRIRRRKKMTAHQTPQRSGVSSAHVVS